MMPNPNAAADAVAALLDEHAALREEVQTLRSAFEASERTVCKLQADNQELRRENERLRGYLIRFLAIASDAQHVATGTPPPPPPPPMVNPVGGIAARDAIAAVGAATRAGK